MGVPFLQTFPSGFGKHEINLLPPSDSVFTKFVVGLTTRSPALTPVAKVGVWDEIRPPTSRGQYRSDKRVPSKKRDSPLPPKQR